MPVDIVVDVGVAGVGDKTWSFLGKANVKGVLVKGMA
jgi:hypothetical protein